MDDLEPRLTQVLFAEAERVDVPPYDIQALALAGRREGHRTRVRALRYSMASVAVIALAVAGVGLAVHSTTDSDAPNGGNGIATHQSTRLPTLADLPRGAAPAVPYWVDGYLHLGTRRIEMPQPRIVSAG